MTAPRLRFSAAALICALTLCACAPRPAKIAPLAIPAKDFLPLSCPELRSDLSANSVKLITAEKIQREARVLDTVGWALFLIPPTILSGDNRADVAIRKGTDQALRQAMAQKGCVEAPSGVAKGARHR